MSGEPAQAGPVDAHGTVTIAQFRADGSAFLQTWLISSDDREYLSGTLHQLIGLPYSETIASADAVHSIGETALTDPGAVTDFRDHP